MGVTKDDKESYRVENRRTTMDNQTQTQQGNDTGGQTCPNCDMPREEWQGNGGQGFQAGEQTYCCQGCAIGTGCTCQ